MFQQFLSDSAHLGWPLFALVLFFLTFVAVVVLLLAGFRRRDLFAPLPRLPLAEALRSGREAVRDE